MNQITEIKVGVAVGMELAPLREKFEGQGVHIITMDNFILIDLQLGGWAEQVLIRAYEGKATVEHKAFSRAYGYDTTVGHERRRFKDLEALSAHIRKLVTLWIKNDPPKPAPIVVKGGRR